MLLLLVVLVAISMELLFDEPVVVFLACGVEEFATLQVSGREGVPVESICERRAEHGLVLHVPMTKSQPSTKVKERKKKKKTHNSKLFIN